MCVPTLMTANTSLESSSSKNENLLLHPLPTRADGTLGTQECLDILRREMPDSPPVQEVLMMKQVWKAILKLLRLSADGYFAGSQTMGNDFYEAAVYLADTHHTSTTEALLHESELREGNSETRP